MNGWHDRVDAPAVSVLETVLHDGHELARRVVIEPSAVGPLAHPPTALPQTHEVPLMCGPAQSVVVAQ